MPQPYPYTDHNTARTAAIRICNRMRQDPRLSPADAAKVIWTTSDDDGYEIIIDRRFTQSPSDTAICWRLTEHGDQWTLSANGEPDMHFGQKGGA